MHEVISKTRKRNVIKETIPTETVCEEVVIYLLLLLQDRRAAVKQSQGKSKLLVTILLFRATSR